MDTISIEEAGRRFLDDDHFVVIGSREVEPHMEVLRALSRLYALPGASGVYYSDHYFAIVLPVMPEDIPLSRVFISARKIGWLEIRKSGSDHVSKLLLGDEATLKSGGLPPVLDRGYDELIELLIRHGLHLVK